MKYLVASINLLFVLSFNILAQENPYKPPLYWDVYEYHIVREQAGVSDNYIPESEFLANINWVDENLKSYGYNIIAVDGWGDLSQLSEHGYRKSHSNHWQHDFAWWSDFLQSKNMTLGMYINPLWIHVSENDQTTKIVGTDINVSSLINPNEDALWFTWVQVERPGAEEYVKGYVQYYADMGVKFLRVDFLSWYETGYDRNLGNVGPTRPQENYITALRWMREACDSNGMYLSLVMPNLTNEAEVEKQFGRMIRINEDTGYGEWWKFSEKDRGFRYPEWSQYANAFDGFTYWSYISGRDKIRLDGDFIRLNTFASDNEKRTVISTHLIAGGPLAVSDQYNTIGDDVWLYQNSELLELNQDAFVGQPITNNPTDEESQIWRGQLSNGDWVVGLFNRENDIRIRNINFSDFGITANVSVRDLWQHNEIGILNDVSVELPPHGSMILKLSDSLVTKQSQEITFQPIEDRNYSEGDFEIFAESDSGLPIEFGVALGPAEINGNIVHLTGESGSVFIVAKQNGNNDFFAAIPKVRSFNVANGHQAEMHIAGTFTGWALNVNMNLVNNIWQADNVSIPAGNQELKFANTTNWSGDDWGNAVGLSGVAQLATGGRPNIVFTMQQSGNYSIYFDDISLQYSIGTPIVSIDENEVVTKFELFQNYPNPFSVKGGNPSTKIKFSIPNNFVVETRHASSLRVYNLLGEQVAELVNSQLSSGVYEVEFSAKDLPSGIYFYRITFGEFAQTKKMILLK